MHRRRQMAFFFLACLPLNLAWSQDVASYPSRLVRVVIAFAPGSSTDTQTRIFAQKLNESLRQPIVVENRTSAGGASAFSLVAKAPPDGYTLLATTASLTLAPAFYKNVPDPSKDFAAISLMTKAPYLLVVHPSVPAKSVKELVALAKANPGKLNWSGGTNGTLTQIAALWFFSLAHMKATLIPYNGGGPAAFAVISGEVDATLGNVLGIAPHLKTGRLRALGVSSMQRSKVLPELPTIAEQGVIGYDLISTYGWLAPAGTPRTIIDKLSNELAHIVNTPDIAERLKDDGGEPVGSTPAQFQQLISTELVRWRKLVQDNGLKTE